jgi:hypothetical protein
MIAGRSDSVKGRHQAADALARACHATTHRLGGALTTAWPVPEESDPSIDELLGEIDRRRIRAGLAPIHLWEDRP